jgi:hypothetical protein
MGRPPFEGVQNLAEDCTKDARRDGRHHRIAEFVVYRKLQPSVTLMKSLTRGLAITKSHGPPLIVFLIDPTTSGTPLLNSILWKAVSFASHRERSALL